MLQSSYKKKPFPSTAKKGIRIMSWKKHFLYTSFTVFVLFFLMIGSASAAVLGVGTVNVEALRLREEASTESKTLMTVYQDEHVIVLEKINEEWYKVNYKTMIGYMFREYLNIETEKEAELGYGQVKDVDSSLNVRAGAGTSNDKIGALSRDAVVKIIGIKDGWYHIASDDYTGYVSSDYLELCDSSAKTAEQGNVPTSIGEEPGTATTDSVVAYAKQFLGVPYVYGANGPDSFDCSGFTKYVYAHFGYSLNRSASGQLDNGREVALSEIRPGDLVFFIYDGATTRASHVGIYIGNDQFIHASTGNSYAVVISQLLGGSYKRTIVGVRRII